MVIVVVDMGVDLLLVDLKGVVDIKIGYNYVDCLLNVIDDNGYGIYVVGIIVVFVNNNYLMVGINFYVKILLVKILDVSGSGDIE